MSLTTISLVILFFNAAIFTAYWVLRLGDVLPAPWGFMIWMNYGVGVIILGIWLFHKYAS